MKRNIIISIEADGIADTTGNAFPTPDTSITETSKSVSLDSELTTQNQESPDEPITNLGTPLQTDRWIYRIVVSALALTIVSCIGSAVWLQSQDKEIPEILTGLGTGALGGLAGLLAPTLSKH
ncbi:hypothetical protein [Scytonema sp. PCC 10023]|uniref:hypothetical protein n=1 Tax=Scytonema sp. PCC 10023 TaxID=1680591 RepID=UPI0039C6D5BC